MSKVYWTMTSETYHQYKQLSDEMVTAARDQDLLRYKQAEDKFRSLPGLPRNIHPELDLVVPRIKDESGKIITVGTIH